MVLATTILFYFNHCITVMEVFFSQNWSSEMRQSLSNLYLQLMREQKELGQEYGLFAAYHKRQKKDVAASPFLQLSHYLDISEGQNALLFWAMNINTLPSLFSACLQCSSGAGFQPMVASYCGPIVHKWLADFYLTWSSAKATPYKALQKHGASVTPTQTYDLSVMSTVDQEKLFARFRILS